MFTLLHISDLHRSKEEPLDNSSLLASLVYDRDRYERETPQVAPPEAIIVSGDLVQGAGLGDTDWPQCIMDQYAVAGEFLSELCDRFLRGDKSRVVLVPGNHDVCWNTAFHAMERVPNDKYPDKLHEELVDPGSMYRWSWKDQTLFRISDIDGYQKRLDHYWEFVESFYKDVDLRIKIDRVRHFQLFELCNRRIIVAAFSSIDRNDCFSYSGDIAAEAIGQCVLGLRDWGHSYDLKIAVWHHSIQGPPLRSDYMDASLVQQMAGHGFQLGLHGHQHVSETLAQSVHLADENLSMAVVGAGSLCAGSRDLPRGVDRQYNLIAIEDDFAQARVHVREMGEGRQFTRKRNGAFLDGFVEVHWQVPTKIMGGETDTQAANEGNAIFEAEEALHRGDAVDAEIALRGIDVSAAGHARKLFSQALEIQQDWNRLTNLLDNPQSVEETVMLVMALTKVGQLDEAQARLDSDTNVDPATRAGLQGRIDARQRMRQL